MPQLTTRELVLNALNHRYSGRFPTDLSLRPEPEKALSDASSMLTLDGLSNLLEEVLRIRNAASVKK